MENKAVSAELYALIRLLMQDPLLGSVNLVGDTALAIYLGHRQSVDIDLFINEDFDSSRLASHFEKTYKAVQIVWETNTLRAFINGIKVELISHQYPFLKEIEIKDGVRLASLNDLAAFKLNAISGRGNRKDFWDLEALLDHFSLAQMIGFFKEKYAANDIWHLIRSLSYFQDAEEEQIEVMDLQGKSWATIKENIQKALHDYKTLSV